MEFVCRLFRQAPNEREGVITAVSALGIAVNLLIAAAKVVLGLFASSIAIVSEGVNNASDAMTSVLTLAGSRLAGKHPDAKHPFGYGRVEYLTSLVIAGLILFTGIEMLIGSVRLIFEPSELNVSVPALAVVAVSAVIKFLLGVFTVSAGKRSGSGALVGVGLDCRNDSFISVVTILSAVIFIVSGVSVDAYVGALMSLLVVKAGFDVLRDTVSELLGRPGDAELAAKLYREIRSTPGILGAVDMMLHNYGPDAYSGSVNVEIDHEKTVGEVYDFLHALQLRIMREYNVTLVFGVYAVDGDHEEVRVIRQRIAEFVRAHEHVKSFHAVYLDPASPRLYCDLIVDYELRDWSLLRGEFTDFMRESFPERELVLTIETEFV